MQDISGQVLGVTGRQSKNGQHTMYDVAFSDGNKYTTFDQAMATKAQQLVGQPVTARVEVKQNGRYTNYNLEDVFPAGQAPPLAQPVAGVPVVGTPIPITPAGENGGGKKGFGENDIIRIAKLGAIGSAVDLVGNLLHGAGPEALDQALELVDKAAAAFYTKARSHEAPAAPAAVLGVEVPTTPAEVAAAVPGVEVGVGAVETPPAEAPSVQW
jgi:hypothetical protein